MTFCTYLFKDPKTLEWRYVGQGHISRPKKHVRRSSNPRLHNLLQKRLLEGFQPQPVIIRADTKEDAIEMEMLLIAMIGRADLGTGSLFNLTDGGDGCRNPVKGRIRPKGCYAKEKNGFFGHKHTPEAKVKMRQKKVGYMPLVSIAAAAKANKGKKHALITCPHCEKVGARNTMPRWHFDNCKLK